MHNAVKAVQLMFILYNIKIINLKIYFNLNVLKIDLLITHEQKANETLQWTVHSIINLGYILMIH